MRVYGPNGTAVATAPSPARRSASGTFALSDSEPTQAQNAAVALRTLGGIDALIALQGIEEPAERRRRAYTSEEIRERLQARLAEASETQA